MMNTPWPYLIPIVAIIGGFVIAGLGLYAQIRRREFEHRERLAMIEKGVAPPGAPSGPAAGGVLPTTADAFGDDAWPESRGARLRRGGFIVMAVGLGVGFMIWMTSGARDDALGIGGLMVILGAGIFLSSLFGRGESAGRDAKPRR